jgi:hypothetical protein
VTELELSEMDAQDEGEFEATLPLNAESRSALRKLPRIGGLARANRPRLMLGPAFVSRSRHEFFDLLNNFAADLQIGDPFEGLHETPKFSDFFFLVEF